jgi:hypothetical protein
MVMAVATALAAAAVYAGRKFREIAKYYYGGLRSSSAQVVVLVAV